MPNVVVISGGTATNSIKDVFQRLAQGEKPDSGTISYIMPISDNGGSTSEIIRVLGGCSVGDIRSRITRLIPEESKGLRKLLSYRLPAERPAAKDEWQEIVDGSHHLWGAVDPACKEIVRSFLIHVHTEILKRSRNSSKNFRLELASIGNLFLTGARLFCGSLESSIELVLRITRVPSNIRVLPCINTNFTYHISALLTDGTLITGQSQISHPSLPAATVADEHHRKPPHLQQITPDSDSDSNRGSDEDDEFAVPSYTHPELKKSQLHFNKNDNVPLPAPVDRIFYISPYGEEIYPIARSRVVNCLSDADTVVYSIGSLMTSIIPVLVLQGIGEAIRDPAKKKVLLLNGSWDRETAGMSALDCIKAIYKALEYSTQFPPATATSAATNGGQKKRRITKDKPVHAQSLSTFVTHICYIEGSTDIPVDTEEIEKYGVKCIQVKHAADTAHRYDQDDLYEKLAAIGK